MVKGLLNLLGRWRWVNANESSVWPLPGFKGSRNDNSRKPIVHIDVMICTHQDPQSSNCCRLLLTLCVGILPRMLLMLVNTGHQCIDWSGLTLPSHVKNLPVSLGVVVAITFSMEDTEYSTLMIPSTCQPTEISAAISLQERH